MKTDIHSKPAVRLYKKILSGNVKRFPTGYWTSFDSRENAKDITIYLLERKLKWKEPDIKTKISKRIFINNGLSGMLRIVFNGSAFNVLENAYPGKFKKSDLSSYIVSNEKIILWDVINSITKKYNNIIFDTLDCSSESFIFKSNNNISCNASIEICKKDNTVIIQFNLNKILDNINKHKLDPELYITYLLFHEYGHLLLYREEAVNRDKIASLLCQSFDNKDSEKLFKKYLICQLTLKESLCDSIAINIAKEYLDNKSYYKFIDNMKFMISYYDESVINILTSKDAI